MKPRQIPIDERVECIERFIIFGFLTVITFKTTTENQAHFLGINLIIFHLTVFFISFPIAFYYFFKMVAIFGESTGRLGERLGKSVGEYLQKHESKLKNPFRLSLVLVAILIAHYILGKDLSDIIYAVLLIVVGVVIKRYLDENPKTIKKYLDDNTKKKKKKKLTTQKIFFENKNDT